MKRVVVLGAGLVGKVIARDLARNYEVTSVDRSAEALEAAFRESKVGTARVDLSDLAGIMGAVKDCDVAVGALPGSLGRRALKAVIEAGRDVVDIAFSPEDPFELDAPAKAKGVTAIVDFGLAPGMSNLFAGYHQKRMAEVARFECLVGGLPAVREPPFEYKAVFSPADVIEEYTRPARLVEDGRVVVRPALSEVEQVEFEGVGALEAFNTDGLRTLLETLKARTMKEKTLRYPGHAQLMRALRDGGFFDERKIEVAGQMVSPRDFTSRILFPQWKMKPGDEDLTVMRVRVEGVDAGGAARKVEYTLLDKFDRASATTSMARTTGYACTAAVRLLAERKFSRPGVCPPEFVGEDEQCYRFVLGHLEERGVRYLMREEKA